MKKRILAVLISGILVMGLTACFHEHVWQDATCTEPMTCIECGKTEGEVLPHTWVAATCTMEEHCDVCGTIVGELVPHDFADPNYQQAEICRECGFTVGLPWEASQAGVETRAKLDVVYDLEMPCNGDYAEEYSMVSKVMFTNYNVFDSDENHPAKDGYEWRTVEMICVAGDQNARDYGFHYKWWIVDYYWSGDFRDGGEGRTFTINYNGVDYTECWYICDVTGNGWEDNEQYGWPRTNTKHYTISALVPKGDDGLIFGLYDWTADCWESGPNDVEDWESIPSEEYLFFRFE